MPAFWLHLAAGLTIGGGILWFFNDSTFDWIVVAVTGLLFMAVGNALSRSSWAVLGALGFLMSAFYFAGKWSGVEAFSLFDGESGDVDLWVAPAVLAVTGLFFLALAGSLAHRRPERDDLKLI